MSQHRTIKPVLEVLAGRRQPVPPVWFMRQAGRYLPEYRELRTRAGSFLDLCFTPELAAEATLQPIRRFGFDAAILFSDILVVPHALGRSVTFEAGEGPRLEPLDSAEKLDAIVALPDEEVFAPVYEAVRLVKAVLHSDIALLGFCGAPWTVATYMVAGHGTPDQAPARLMAYREPAAFARLIDILVEASSRYLVGQLRAGADAVPGPPVLAPPYLPPWSCALAPPPRGGGPGGGGPASPPPFPRFAGAPPPPPRSFGVRWGRGGESRPAPERPGWWPRASRAGHAGGASPRLFRSGAAPPLIARSTKSSRISAPGPSSSISATAFFRKRRSQTSSARLPASARLAPNSSGCQPRPAARSSACRRLRGCARSPPRVGSIATAM